MKYPKPKKQKSEKKILDELWTKCVNARDKVCQRPECPHCRNLPFTKGLQAHHIFPRTNYRLRWEVKNGVLLCSGSHKFWVHGLDPRDILSVLEFYKTLPGWALIYNLAGQRHGAVDKKLIRVYLESYLEEISK